MTDKERLVNEWLEHGKIVLAVDYDDTIFHWRHRSQKECDETIRLVKWAQTTGAYVIIHSCSDDDRHDEMLAFCHFKGLEIDTINKNAIELPYGQQGKPYYNWQLCDRSGLQYASEVLEEAIKEVISINNNVINLSDIA
tara:strand:+ start:11147 stop:11563 length:417 start_codon:yes stop_codon:yes gene_type:complete